MIPTRKQVERWLRARMALFCAEEAGWDTSGQKLLLEMAEKDIRDGYDG